jgi:hypothetical protein
MTGKYVSVGQARSMRNYQVARVEKPLSVQLHAQVS